MLHGRWLMAFRAEGRVLLTAQLPYALRLASARATSVFSGREVSLPWQRILHARGWAAPDWPAEFGGPGWSEIERYIVAAECARAGAPNLAPMGLKKIGRAHV